MRPEDIGRIVKVVDHCLSPDGTFAIAVVARPIGHETRRTLWRVSVAGGESPRELTAGADDAAPSVSPDGRSVAFIRRSHCSSQLCVYDVSTGALIVLAEHVSPIGLAATIRHVRGISPPQWSPDARRLAYAVPVPLPKEYPSSSVQRIRQLPYQVDGRGRIDDNHIHIFLADAAGQVAPMQFSTRGCDHWDVSWRPDSRALCFASFDTLEDGSSIQAVFEAAAPEQASAASSYRRVTDGCCTVNLPTYSPDARTIYFIGIGSFPPGRPDIRGRNVSLWRVDATRDSAAPNVVSDSRFLDIDETRLRPLLVTSTTSVTVAALSQGRVDLGEVADTTWQSFAECQQQVTSYCRAGDVTTAVLADNRHAGDLFVLERGEWRQLTRFSDEYADVTRVDAVSTTARTKEGYPVQGWVLLPEGKPPHPAILLLHGGPDTQWGYFLNEDAQVLVDAGFAVLLPNPRGSAGYGEDHARILNGRVGTIEIEDALAFLDAVISRGEVDANRIGVTGRSYAGFMTAWLAAHHGSRFKAALGECAIYDWTSVVLTSDVGCQLTAMVGADKATWIDRSPISYVQDIEIPFMIMQYLGDLRIPAQQGHQFFAALYRKGIATELVQFDGGPHMFADVGPLQERITRAKIMVDWFNRWLPIKAARETTLYPLARANRP